MICVGGCGKRLKGLTTKCRDCKDRDLTLKGRTGMAQLGEIEKPKEEVFKKCENCGEKIPTSKKKYCSPCSDEVKMKNNWSIR